MSASSAPLVLTPGEPSGIGAEITAKAWEKLNSHKTLCFALLGDVEHLRAMAAKAGIAISIEQISDVRETNSVFAKALPVLHRPLPCAVTPGTFTAATASWVTEAISEAVDLCLSAKAAAMVTNPIQKEALYSAGFKHQGHTDFLAELARAKGHAPHDVMMLVSEGLRTIPVTVHIPLKDVAGQLTTAEIVAQAIVVAEGLRKYFGIASPRLAVAGLNPHAGENGTMGREDIEIVAPAVAALKAKGVNAFGPLPADTAFFPSARACYDAILCMYHDQALIPIKTLDFHGGVNVTLGLPFIRTSPDHGTALALAGTGRAQADSLIAALNLAHTMSENARKVQ